MTCPKRNSNTSRKTVFGYQQVRRGGQNHRRLQSSVPSRPTKAAKLAGSLALSSTSVLTTQLSLVVPGSIIVDPWTTAADSISRYWCDGCMMSVMPGRFDHSNWPMLLQTYRGTLFSLAGSSDPRPICELPSLCRQKFSRPDSNVIGFIIVFTTVLADLPCIYSAKERSRISALLAQLSPRDKIIRFIRLQAAADQIYNRWQSKLTRNHLTAMARGLKIRMVRKQYRAPARWHHHLSSAKYTNAVQKVARSRSLPADCTKFIASRTRGSFKQTVNRGQPEYVNCKAFTSDFDVTPP